MILCDRCQEELDTKVDAGCDIDGCQRYAKYELWWNVGSGGVICKLRVCEAHKQEEVDRRRERSL